MYSTSPIIERIIWLHYFLFTQQLFLFIFIFLFSIYVLFFFQFPLELDPWEDLKQHIMSDYLNHEVS